MNIAIIGSGNIGGTLARKWGAAGHQIAIGARDPAKSDVQAVVKDIGPKAKAVSIAEALNGADAVLFAVPGGAMAETVKSLGKELDGKVVIDATNNIGGQSFNSVHTITSAAPKAHVYRAFNIYGFENFADPVVGGVQADLFYAGPDGASRQHAETLIKDVGLNPVWMGGDDKAELVDQFLRIWFTLAGERKHGRRLAFKLLEP